jgi:mycoredoxin
MNDDQRTPIDPTEGIIIYGTEWCPDCTRARRFLERNKITYAWINIDAEKTAERLVRSLNQGRRSVPTILFPDGSILVEPSDRVLAEKLRVEL